MRAFFLSVLIFATHSSYSQATLSLPFGGDYSGFSRAVPCECPQIGGQSWANHDLDAKYFRDGKQILQVRRLSEWELMTTFGVPIFLDPKTCEDCGTTITAYTDGGFIYNIWALTSPSNLAPDGWRIPTDKDWEEQKVNVKAEGFSFSHKDDPGCISALKSKRGWDSYTTGGYTRYKTCPNCGSWSDLYKRQVACDVCKGHGKIGTYEPEVTKSGNGIDAFGFNAIPLPAIRRKYNATRDDIPEIPKCELVFAGNSLTYWSQREDLEFKTNDWEIYNLKGYTFYRLTDNKLSRALEYAKDPNYVQRTFFIEITSTNSFALRHSRLYEGHFVRCIRE